MKKSELKVGGHYLMKVSGTVQTVRLDAIRETSDYKGRSKTVYDCTNLRTGRACKAESAARFRGIACQHHFPNAEYDTGGRLLNDCSCKKCGNTPSAQWFREQRIQSGITITGPKTGISREPEVRPGPYDGIEDSSDYAASGASNPMNPAESGKQMSDIPLRGAIQPSNGSPHLIVEALAGTGKTTTLIEGLKLVKGLPTSIVPSPQQQAVWDAMRQGPAPKSICFVAFNKAIATELQQRVPPGVDAMTMHSMGFRAVTKMFGRQEPSEWAVQDIIARLMGMDVREIKRDAKLLAVLTATDKLVALCKQNLVGLGFGNGHNEPEVNWGACWDEELSKLAHHYDVDLNGSREQVFALVPASWKPARPPRVGSATTT